MFSHFLHFFSENLIYLFSGVNVETFKSLIYPSLSAFEHQDGSPICENIFLAKSAISEKTATAPILLLEGYGTIVIHDTRQVEPYMPAKGIYS